MEMINHLCFHPLLTFQVSSHLFTLWKATKFGLEDFSLKTLFELVYGWLSNMVEVQLWCEEQCGALVVYGFKESVENINSKKYISILQERFLPVFTDIWTVTIFHGINEKFNTIKYKIWE